MSIIVNRHITFIESLQFYNGSLEALASNLNNEDFKHLTSEFGIDKLEILKKNVWDTFNFNTSEDFHNHYLKKDVLLLADVFEKFIFTCLKYFDLDPCHYFNAPGLSWDSMLKITGVTLAKLRDPDKYMFFEQGMRGGVNYINKR